jgi:hypothetical protein
MTPDQIAEARERIKAITLITQCDNAWGIADIAEKALDEVERLKTFINPKLLDDNLTGKWILDTGELVALRAVAELAEELLNCGWDLELRLKDALKAWRSQCES